MGINSCGTTLIDQGTFKNIGAISWDTTAKTAGFTAVAGTGYFVNTTSGAITVTLPSSPTAGDTVGIADYANTADTNNITIGRNGSNIQGVANDFIINTEGGTIILTYVDATKGWLSIDAAQASDVQQDLKFVTATGGTITTSGNYKIHTFTGPGTFTVTCAGNAAGSNSVDYLVIAGGAGGGGRGGGGGGGAGGYRESVPSPAAWTASPKANPGGSLPVTATGYPITVGSGGAGEDDGAGAPGNNSVFSTITSAGGGGGGGGQGPFSGPPSSPGKTGGSGGGANTWPSQLIGAAGNTPPVSPPQGNPGGNGIPSPQAGGGGGGAGVAGSNGTAPIGGPGGNGVATSITGSSVTRGGGGGGASNFGAPSGGLGGTGGGGTGMNSPSPSGPSVGGSDGTANTGGGGGGAGQLINGKNGGSGIVIIRYKYQ